MKSLKDIKSIKMVGDIVVSNYNSKIHNTVEIYVPDKLASINKKQAQQLVSHLCKRFDLTELHTPLRDPTDFDKILEDINEEVG